MSCDSPLDENGNPIPRPIVVRDKISAAWRNPDDSPSVWQRIVERTIPGAKGLAVTISAGAFVDPIRGELGGVWGRLVAKVAYTDLEGCAVEFDVQKQETIWIPGERVEVWLRVEDPVTYRQEGEFPNIAPNQGSTLGVGVEISEANISMQRNLSRSVSFAVRAPVDIANDALFIPIPRGAFQMSRLVGFLIPDDLNFYPVDMPPMNVMGVNYFNAGRTPTYAPHVDYSDLFNPGRDYEKVPIPGHILALRIISKLYPEPLLNSLVTLVFDIQP